MKKLYRSRKNKILGGVIGGLGKYFDVDPVLLRLIAIFFFIASGFVPLGLVYVIALVVVPEEPA